MHVIGQIRIKIAQIRVWGARFGTVGGGEVTEDGVPCGCSSPAKVRAAQHPRPPPTGKKQERERDRGRQDCGRRSDWRGGEREIFR
jgi:hypothetical protein